MSMEGFLLKYSMNRSKKEHLQLVVKENCELDLNTIADYFSQCVKWFGGGNGYVMGMPGTYWKKI